MIGGGKEKHRDQHRLGAYIQSHLIHSNIFDCEQIVINTAIDTVMHLYRWMMTS